MPAPIDMANTTNVVDNKATWVLTQVDFTHENKLKIITNQEKRNDHVFNPDTQFGWKIR